jgi:hypothetical protein
MLLGVLWASNRSASTPNEYASGLGQTIVRGAVGLTTRGNRSHGSISRTVAALIAASTRVAAPSLIRALSM